MIIYSFNKDLVLNQKHSFKSNIINIFIIIISIIFIILNILILININTEDCIFIVDKDNDNDYRCKDKNKRETIQNIIKYITIIISIIFIILNIFNTLSIIFKYYKYNIKNISIITLISNIIIIILVILVFKISYEVFCIFGRIYYKVFILKKLGIKIMDSNGNEYELYRKPVYHKETKKLICYELVCGYYLQYIDNHYDDYVTHICYINNRILYFNPHENDLIFIKKSFKEDLYKYTNDINKALEFNSLILKGINQNDIFEVQRKMIGIKNK